MQSIVQECGMGEIIPGDAVINGVVLSQRVLDEVRRLGFSLASYTQGELEDAVDACHFDGQLIDDPNGLSFRDRLVLTDQEKALLEKTSAAA